MEKIDACQNDDELLSQLSAEKTELDPEMMGAVSGGIKPCADCLMVLRDNDLHVFLSER